MSGTLTKVTGQAKRLVGKATGNRRLANRGRADEVKGQIKQRATRARRRIRQTVNRAEKRIRAR
jgi:uncharacterized protein YjbJ (UPF0337 family)